jgi:hypothetical protein
VKTENVQIHFTDEKVLDCTGVDMVFHDHGINFDGRDECVFIPYGVMNFVRLFKQKK